MTTLTALTTLNHWINGESVTADTDTRLGDITNPATGVGSGQVALGSKATVESAIAAAAEAFPAWRDTSLSRRTAILFNFRELLNARKQELAEIITAEHGKVVSDALGEVARGQEVVEFACGIASHLKGGHTENASTSVDVHSLRQPLGVCAIISPFNFPAMVPMWFFPVAIAAGNTVVLKPSEKAPSAANWLAELWKEAGLPDGVFNVVHGDKEAVDTILESPQVASVSFVGSTPIAKYVYENGTAAGKRVQALGGAKNHMLVLPDADLDLAADAAVNAGYGAAGERCMAISVVVAVESIADELVAKIAERTRTLRIGDGTTEPDMGPLVTAAHRDKVAGYIDAGAEAGATVVLDGRDHDHEQGFFLNPTLFDNVTTDMSIYTDEIFGPVLAVVRVPGYDEGLELINANPYGNGTAIFTNDGGAARRYENEVEVGMVGINVPIPVPVGYYSFGGWKNSLFGDTHGYGEEGVHFFTRGKVVTSRWLDPSHGGLNLGFPTND
ncbi:CoA-acylating methylmalonate-semialdehyde dehydrogenase [Brevibacterium atlanticum]|uniref:CoA-acylating methylmalonate-semialdehyde dehydrogenase n=1 Tax=Brevibacterium atlanticum TaxID=2697563 RepID=UPI0014221FDE|nr:CoA-acylating methylmalonate-semialdehyde dehydrogenase [Brevibacterium atlanticum]